MGWNTYYGVGGIYDEATIRSVADALVARGLARAGYRVVWLDHGWATGARDADGDLVIDERQWPHGLDALTSYLHGRGLLAGIYSDAGRSGGEGKGVGSLGHYERDADRFAAWGFDAVKIDFVGGGQERLDPVEAYREFAAALRGNASGRPLIVNACNFWMPGHLGGGYPPWERSSHANYRWAPAIADSWRTETDIGFTGRVAFGDVLRNLDANAAHPDVAGPGHWNDPDYLAPEIGLSAGEARAQLSMWALMAAPLIIGSDVRELSDATVAMLTNEGVIGVDQDPLGIQGRRAGRHGSGEVWVKPLEHGDRAIALLNRGEGTRRVVARGRALGRTWRSAVAGARDLWTGEELPGGRRLVAEVPGHGVALYRTW
jgi:alpha-galactosidase